MTIFKRCPLCGSLGLVIGTLRAALCGLSEQEWEHVRCWRGHDVVTAGTRAAEKNGRGAKGP